MFSRYHPTSPPRKPLVVLKRSIDTETRISVELGGETVRDSGGGGRGGLGGASSFPIYASKRNEQRAPIPLHERVQISVGKGIDRRDVVRTPTVTVRGIPKLYPSATPQAEAETLFPPHRGIINQILTGGLPVAVKVPTPPPPVISPPASKSGHAGGVNKIKAPTTTRENEMDLGDILGNAVNRYIDYKYAPPTIIPQVQPALNLPFVDVIPEAPTVSAESEKGMVYNPRANCGQGGWVKHRRRRRRRLATVSDIKDLAALKSVLGQGKAFETWIATHS